MSDARVDVLDGFVFVLRDPWDTRSFRIHEDAVAFWLSGYGATEAYGLARDRERLIDEARD